MATNKVPHENPEADSGIHAAATPAEHPSDVVIPSVGACPHDLRFLAASAIEALGVNVGDHASKERISNTAS